MLGEYSPWLYCLNILCLQKGNTALHIAALAGQEEIVKILLQSGAKVNAQASVGRKVKLLSRSTLCQGQTRSKFKVRFLVIKT